MARWAIFETATGRLVTDTAVQPNGLRAGLSSVSVPDSDEGLMWDAATRTYIARPPKVLVNTPRDLLWVVQQDPRFLALNSQQQSRVLALVTDVFGNVRFT